MEDKFKNAFGALESPRDYRDIASVSALGTPDLGKYPRKHFNKIDLEPFDQKRNGSCVGQAGAKYLQTLELAENGKSLPFSAQFLYALCKAEDGIPEVSGTYPRVLMNVLKKKGGATDKTFKTDNNLSESDFKDVSKIKDKAYKEALTYAIKSYARIGQFNNVLEDELVQAIYKTNGVVMSFRVGLTWTKKDGRHRPALPIKTPNPETGGHLVYVYGYEYTDEDRLKLYFINSWGDDWGEDGIGYLYYDEHFPFIKEAWTVVDLPNDWQERELPPAPAFAYSWNVDMKEGQTSEDIRQLQIALAIEGVWTRPDILATGYYGPITSASVLAFWKKYGIASSWETTFLKGKSAGPKTRAKLNELYSPNLPTPSPSKLDAWAKAIQWYEGYFTPAQYPPSGSRSYRNNNPGNLRWSPFQDGNVDNFSVFSSYEKGYNALKYQLTLAVTGKSSVYNPDMTLIEFFSKYAPSSDNNYPVKYAEAVAERIGVPATTQIKNLI